MTARSLDLEANYFPTPDTPGFEPFARAFVHLMFAHAKFERQIRELQSAIADTLDTDHIPFGEQPANQLRDSRKRPKLMAKWIRDKLGESPEEEKIIKCLCDAIPFDNKRNLLTHGTWWKFKFPTITVARGTVRLGEEQHVSFTVDQIEAIAEKFGDFEAELWKLKRSIEDRRQSATR